MIKFTTIPTKEETCKHGFTLIPGVPTDGCAVCASENAERVAEICHKANQRRVQQPQPIVRW